MPDIDIVKLLYIVPVVLLSLSFHEFSHALVASLLGDTTARNAGRLSIYPQKHLDPIGTIMIIISSMAGYGIGWAKPVPVNPSNFKNPKSGSVIVSLAGPVSNLLLAFLFAAPMLYIEEYSRSHFMPDNSVMEIIYNLSWFFFRINISLAIFNMIPVPPLDGSKVLSAFLPARQYFQLMRYENYIGIGFLMIILIFPRALRSVMLPLIETIGDFIINIVSPIVNMLI